MQGDRRYRTGNKCVDSDVKTDTKNFMQFVAETQTLVIKDIGESMLEIYDCLHNKHTFAKSFEEKDFKFVSNKDLSAESKTKIGIWTTSSKSGAKFILKRRRRRQAHNLPFGWGEKVTSNIHLMQHYYEHHYACTALVPMFVSNDIVTILMVDFGPTVKKLLEKRTDGIAKRFAYGLVIMCGKMASMKIYSKDHIMRNFCFLGTDLVPIDDENLLHDINQRGIDNFFAEMMRTFEDECPLGKYRGLIEEIWAKYLRTGKLGELIKSAIEGLSQ